MNYKKLISDINKVIAWCFIGFSIMLFSIAMFLIADSFATDILVDEEKVLKILKSICCISSLGLLMLNGKAMVKYIIKRYKND